VSYVRCFPRQWRAVDHEDVSVTWVSMLLSFPKVGRVDPAVGRLVARWSDEDAAIGGGEEVFGDAFGRLDYPYGWSCYPSCQFRRGQRDVGASRARYEEEGADERADFDASLGFQAANLLVSEATGRGGDVVEFGFVVSPSGFMGRRAVGELILVCERSDDVAVGHDEALFGAAILAAEVGLEVPFLLDGVFFDEGVDDALLGRRVLRCNEDVVDVGCQDDRAVRGVEEAGVVLGL